MDCAVEANAEITNRFGLHLGPATIVAKTAMRFRSKIWIVSGDKAVSARSVVEMTSLGARSGTQLKIRAEGPDAEDALRAVRLLFQTGFGEE